MTDREKLVGLLDIIIQPGQKTLGEIAEYLLANGVAFAKDTNVGGKSHYCSKCHDTGNTRDCPPDQCDKKKVGKTKRRRRRREEQEP